MIWIKNVVQVKPILIYGESLAIDNAQELKCILCLRLATTERIGLNNDKIIRYATV